jgi:hypothetical protein
MTQRPNGLPEGQSPGPAGAAAPSPADTWQNWVTIWQSELNALSTDREAQQSWARLVAMWAAQARAAGALLPGRAFDEPATGRARAEPQAGPAAPAAAPDPGVVERQRLALEHLERRVEELERRLREFGDGAG